MREWTLLREQWPWEPAQVQAGARTLEEVADLDAGVAEEVVAAGAEVSAVLADFLDFEDFLEVEVSPAAVAVDASAEVSVFLDLEDFFGVEVSLADVEASPVSDFLDFEDFLVEAVSLEEAAEASAVSDFLDLEDFFVEEVSRGGRGIRCIGLLGLGRLLGGGRIGGCSVVVVAFFFFLDLAVESVWSDGLRVLRTETPLVA